MTSKQTPDPYAKTADEDKAAADPQPPIEAQAPDEAHTPPATKPSTATPRASTKRKPASRTETFTHKNGGGEVVTIVRDLDTGEQEITR